jgi:hypothetical protein
MHFTHVVVDGSNIATEGRELPSLHQLDEAVRAFMAEHEVDNLTVIVDATFGHRIDASERAEYDEATNNQELTTPPAGAVGRGDAFVLSIADRASATILSNDSFQEFHGQYPWLFDDGRIIGGKPVPGVGWVFVPRVPVRGPISRKAVRDAKSAKPSIPGSTTTRRRRRGGRGEGTDTAEVERTPVKKAARARGGRARPTSDTTAATAADAAMAAGEGNANRRRNRRTRSKPAEPVNEFLPFVEFVGAHPVGSTVEGTVERFSSHGAYVIASGVSCYLPLKNMGDPPPRSARDVIEVGDVRDFVVHELDPPRRSVDLSMASVAATAEAPDDDDRQARNRQGATRDRSAKSRQDTSARGGGALHDAAGVHLDADDLSDEREVVDAAKPNTPAAVVGTTSPTHEHAEEAPVTPAKRATAKKATAKKATRKAAKRAPAKKAARKVAKKTTKRAPAKKAAKKATRKATKKTTKRAPAKKATKKTTKRAPAKKAAKRR